MSTALKITPSLGQHMLRTVKLNAGNEGIGMERGRVSRRVSRRGSGRGREGEGEAKGKGRGKGGEGKGITGTRGDKPRLLTVA